MFKNAKKEDYLRIAYELGIDISDTKLTNYDLMNLIKENDKYKTDTKMVEDMASNIIEERKSDEAKILEFEKLHLARTKLELELAKTQAEKSDSSNNFEKIESIESLDFLIKSIRTLTIKILTQPEGWGYFFSSLERAFISKNVPEKYKSEIFLNLLGERATNVITYIKDGELEDYSKVKAIALREFEPTPQTCLEHFRKAQRSSNETYVQFASRLTTSWDYYLKLRNVTDFETLKQLVISDKICQTLDKDVMCFINVRQGDSWFKPIELSREIGLYYTSKGKPVVDADCSKSNDKKYYSKPVSKVYLTDVKNSKCILSCNESHPLHKCPVYKNMSVSDRVELLKAKNLCFNCLLNHNVVDCKSKFSCIICRKKHSITLHFPREQKINKVDNQEVILQEMSHINNGSNKSNLDVSAPVFQPFEANNQSKLFSTTCNFANELKAVLLSTFVCLIKDEFGNIHEVRGLLDVGANSNFMNKGLVDKLNLKGEKTNISILGINNLSLNFRYKVNTSISNKDKDLNLKLDFLVVPKIKEFTPSRPLETSIPLLNYIKLPDEKFNVPGQIHLFLGAENFYEFLRPGEIYPQTLNTKIVLQNSIFGYIVSGRLPARGESSIYRESVTDNLKLERVIKEFWELENIERESEISKTKESNICEEHFLKNYSRTENEQYMVKMPLKEDPSCLGESKQKAIKILNSSWNRLATDPENLRLYSDFLKEYQHVRRPHGRS